MVCYSTLGIKRKSPEKKTTTPEQNKKPPPANADARKIKEDYPERMLDTRFAQPRWTTVLLCRVRMGKDD
jgi:hypothetical protein